MVALDKQHLLSTCKVKTCLSSLDFLTMFFGKEPNHEYYMPTHSHNPRNYTLHLQFLESMWNRNFFDNNMIWDLL
jgi:hypothetical protein